MQDFRSRNSDDIALVPRFGTVTRMLTIKMIGHAPSDSVKLDAAANGVACRAKLRLRQRQHLGFQQLQLQRHRQPVFWAARSEANEAFASLEHCARDKGLQAVKVRQTIGIRFVRPCQPNALDFILQCLILNKAGWLDTGTHGICHKTVGSI